jgi:hypothetical protein
MIHTFAKGGVQSGPCSCPRPSFSLRGSALSRITNTYLNFTICIHTCSIVCLLLFCRVSLAERFIKFSHDTVKEGVDAGKIRTDRCQGGGGGLALLHVQSSARYAGGWEKRCFLFFNYINLACCCNNHHPLRIESDVIHYVQWGLGWVILNFFP